MKAYTLLLLALVGLAGVAMAEDSGLCNQAKYKVIVRVQLQCGWTMSLGACHVYSTQHYSCSMAGCVGRRGEGRLNASSVTIL